MPDRPRRFVLVTGADSGIGRAAVARLTHAGYDVLAACYTDTVIWDLPAASHDRLHPLRLDLTSPESRGALQQAADQIVGAQGLYGLVNNAGIALGGPQELIDVSVWRQQFEVNVFGTITFTQQMLPLLRRALGARIVNIGSICSLVSYPFVAPYCASKHALDALTMALRGELRPWGIQVTLIAPGLVKTDLWDAARRFAQHQVMSYSAQQREWYAARMERRLTRTISRAGKGLPPDRVAQVIETTMRRARLSPRYVVGRDAKFLYWADRVVPRVALGRFLRRQLGLPG